MVNKTQRTCAGASLLNDYCVTIIMFCRVCTASHNSASGQEVRADPSDAPLTCHWQGFCPGPRYAMQWLLLHVPLQVVYTRFFLFFIFTAVLGNMEQGLESHVALTMRACHARNPLEPLMRNRGLVSQPSAHRMYECSVLCITQCTGVIKRCACLEAGMYSEELCWFQHVTFFSPLPTPVRRRCLRFHFYLACW